MRIHEKGYEIKGSGIAQFLRETNPRVKNFYDPIEERLGEIRTLANSRGLKKFSVASEGLDDVIIERNDLWIRAKDSVCLRITFGEYGDKMTNFAISYMFLWEIFGRGDNGKVIVPVAGLSNDKLNEYQKNILNRIHELADHVGKLYAT